MNRRSFIETGAAGALLSLLGAGVPVRIAGRRTGTFSRGADGRIGICDWSIGKSAYPAAIAAAAELGIDGVQVSVGTSPDRIVLREPSVRERYLDLMSEHGVQIPSVAAGSILNDIPLMSEPQAAVYVIDAVEAARALGAENVLLAFFGDGDLRLRDATDEFRNVSEGSFAEYELDTEGVTRVVDALKQITPRAADADVTIGLENTLTAAQNLEIIERVGSDFVRVYYDVGNSMAYGYDVPGEIRMLGNEMICEMHLKETLSLRDPMRSVLGGPESGGVDFEAVADAVRAIGYDGWYILETGGRDGSEAADTRANVEFVERVFA